MTAIHAAVEAGDLVALRALLAQNAALAGARDNRGRTPLWVAVWKKQLACVDVLLNAGADPATVDDEGTGPVHMAALAGGSAGIALLERLLQAGVSVNQPGKGQWRALHYAAREGEEAAVAWLIDHGADLNCRTAIEETPLHWALYEGQESVALKLIAAGADINAKDEHGDTALHEAARFGYEAVARVLIEKQADADLVNEFGESARAILAASDWSFAAAFRQPAEGG